MCYLINLRLRCRIYDHFVGYMKSLSCTASRDQQPVNAAFSYNYDHAFLKEGGEWHLFELEKGRSRVLKMDSFQDFVKEKLRAFPDTSAAQMHDLLKEHHPWFPQVSQKTAKL